MSAAAASVDRLRAPPPPSPNHMLTVMMATHMVSGRDLGRATLLGQLYVFGSPTSVMIRSELVRDRPRLFDESAFPRHWDSPASLELLRTTDFGFVHQVLTHTRRPPDARTSLSKRLNSYWAEELAGLHRYGPLFLDPDELRERRRYHTVRYYAYLGPKSSLP